MSMAPRAFTLQHLWALELALATGVVTVCMALCVAQVPLIMAKARLTEVLLQAQVDRVDIAERTALTGTPGPALLVRRDGIDLAFRPAVLGGEGDGNALWLCGSHRPPSGWIAPDQEPTRVPPGLLFSVCREAAD